MGGGGGAACLFLIVTIGDSTMKSITVFFSVLAAILSLFVRPVKGGECLAEFEGNMNCQCDCQFPSGSSPTGPCECDCPDKLSDCAPGFCRTCNAINRQCPEGTSIYCPGQLTTTPIPTTTTAQPTTTVFETVEAFFVEIVCQGETHSCDMEATFQTDCSSIKRIKPTCTPKKTKCKNGKDFTYTSTGGCEISARYINTGKVQKTTRLEISAPMTTPGTTTLAPCDQSYQCSCLPDFLTYYGNVALMASPIEVPLPCICLQDSCLEGVSDSG